MHSQADGTKGSEQMVKKWAGGGRYSDARAVLALASQASAQWMLAGVVHGGSKRMKWEVEHGYLGCRLVQGAWASLIGFRGGLPGLASANAVTTLPTWRQQRASCSSGAACRLGRRRQRWWRLETRRQPSR